MTKVITKIVTLLVIMLGLTGCSMNEYYDKANGELWQRASMNLEQLKRLTDAGLLSEDEYQAFARGVYNNLESIGVTATNSVNSASGNKISSNEIKKLINSKDFTKAIRYSVSPPTDSVFGENDTFFGTGVLPEITQEIMDNEVENSNSGNLKLKAFDMLSSSNNQLSVLEKRLQCKVYVLGKANQNAKEDDPNNYITLKELQNNLTNNTSLAGGLFIDSGRTILDLGDQKNRIIRDSISTSGYAVSDDGKQVTKDSSLAVDFNYGQKGVVAQYNYWAKDKTNEEPKGNHNRLGEDLVISQVIDTPIIENKKVVGHDYKITRSISLKMRDFNKSTIDKIIGTTGNTDKVYLVQGDKAYLLEYPVYYVKGWESVLDNGEYKFKAVYAQSDLVLNIYSGKLYHKNGKEVIHPKDNYRYITKTDSGETSFILDSVTRFTRQDTSATKVILNHVDGVTTSTLDGEDTGKYTEYYCNYGAVTWNKNIRENANSGIKDFATEGSDVYTKNLEQYGSIVLRDYLEYTYAPSVISDESLVAIGRMFRLDTYKGTGKEVIGKFVNLDGTDMTNSAEITSDSIIDATDLAKKHKLRLEDSTSTETTETTDTSTNTSDHMGLIGLKADLETEYQDKITTTLRFPSASINILDNNTTDMGDKTKPILYGMSLDIDAYNSNLISNWITEEGVDETKGNLNWWNVWLNDAGYSYGIDANILINSLQHSYNFDITGNDRIILNLNTLSKIQKIYNEEKEKANVGLIITIFKVLGAGLVVYSMLLMVAWLYDINLTVGVKLLSVITFGQWVAITSRNDLPERNTKGTKYIDLRGMVFSCLALISIGVILNVVGVMDILIFAIDLVGSIGDLITDTLLG